MNTTLRLAFFLLFTSATTAYGQLFPADGASLNYTQIMFDHEANTNASYYKLFIEPVDKTGNQSADAPMEFQSVSPALLVKTGLQFGKKYEWRYEAFLKNGEIKGYGPYSFFIAALPQQQNSNTCFTITKKITTAIADDIIFFDNPAVAINRQGEMIWYLPMDTAELKAKDKIRNLHLTPFGSLLYLSPNGISEKTIDGKPLWNGPENTGTAGIGKDIYHHDCQMLPDGSFLVCDYEYVNEPCTFSPADTCQVRYNTLLQINKSGKIIWEWNEKGQADMEDFYAKKNPAIRKTEGTHMNGFGYDTATKLLALSFRNNSRIAKINKETGKLIWSLKPNAGNILYGSQHGAFFTKAGEVLFYNNQAIERGEAITRKEKAVSTPTIIIVKEKENNQPPVKVWEYSCATPAFPNGVRAKEGYAAEQPNGNILVCMGGANRTFEVTRKKELVWECFYEKMDTIKNIWLPQSSYRNHSASSLFPYYFSLQKNSDVVVAQAVSFQLFNDGSNDDTYTISMDTQKGYFKKGVQVIRLKAGEAKQILVPFFKSNAVQKGQHPLQVIVHVSAGNGIGQKRIISFDWK